jgi:hypothetical protein
MDRNYRKILRNRKANIERRLRVSDPFSFPRRMDSSTVWLVSSTMPQISGLFILSADP